MSDFFVGLDLGQIQDFSALCVVGLAEEYLKTVNTPAAGGRPDRLERARRNPYLDETDLKVIRREIEAAEAAGPAKPASLEPVYEVRHLERMPLGTSYVEVARRVKALLDAPPLHTNAILAVDSTGVGRAVVDQLRAAGLSFEAVTITGGDKETEEAPGNWRVPKRDLIARPQVLLQRGIRRLKIAPTLPEAQTLVDELLNFRVKIDPATAHDSYSHWREGEHDDLVLALCLSLWAAEKFGGAPVDETLVATVGPYEAIDPNDLYRADDPPFRFRRWR